MAQPVTDPDILAQLNAAQPGPPQRPGGGKARSYEELGQALKSGERYSRLSKEEQNIVAREERGFFDDKIRGLARGVPFIGSFGDEMNARMNAAAGGFVGGSQAATYDDRFEDNLAYERAKDRTFDQDNPWQSLGAKIVGGVAGTVAAAPAAAATGAWNTAGHLLLGTGAKTLPGAMAHGMTAGLLQGAASGAGDAEGGVVDRAEGAIDSGLIGGAFGLGGPALVTGVGKAASGIRNMVMPKAAPGPLDDFSRHTRREIRDRLSDPAAVQRQMDEVSKLGDHAMLADVSDEWKSVARGAAKYQGARDEVADALAARSGGWIPRIRADLDANLGPAPVLSQVEDGFEAARAALLARRPEFERASSPDVGKALGLKAIDAELAEIQARSDALDRGRKVFATGDDAVHPVTFEEQWNALTPAQQTAMRQGRRADIDRVVGTQARDPAALKQAMPDGEWNNAKARRIFGEEPMDNVSNAMAREARFAETMQDVRKGLGAAADKRFAKTLEDLERGPSIPKDLSVSGLTNAGVQLIAKGLASNLGAGRAERVALELARVSVARGPERDRFVRALVAEGVERQKAERIVRFAAGLAVTTGRESPSRLLPRQGEPESSR